MERPSVNFTVIPVKSTNGRQRSLVDVPKKYKVTRVLLRPVEIILLPQKMALRIQFPSSRIWAV
jgi:hypothetical protein